MIYRKLGIERNIFGISHLFLRSLTYKKKEPWDLRFKDKSERSR
jgi:hypothetical protein